MVQNREKCDRGHLDDLHAEDNVQIILQTLPVDSGSRY